MGLHIQIHKVYGGYRTLFLSCTTKSGVKPYRRLNCRKTILAALFALLVLLLTGCVTQKTQDGILKKAMKEGIIGVDWTDVSSDYPHDTGGFATNMLIPNWNSFHYIYEDSNDNLYMANISDACKNDDGLSWKKYYPLTIISGLESYESPEMVNVYEINSEGKKIFKETREEPCVRVRETDASEKTRYRVYSKQFLVWDIYKITKEQG